MTRFLLFVVVLMFNLLLIIMHLFRRFFETSFPTQLIVHFKVSLLYQLIPFYFWSCYLLLRVGFNMNLGWEIEELWGILGITSTHQSRWSSRIFCSLTCSINSHSLYLTKEGFIALPLLFKKILPIVALLY